MILIAELISHFVNGIANNLKYNIMAKMVKKAQAGDMVSKIKSAAKKADSTVRKTGMNFGPKTGENPYKKVADLSRTPMQRLLSKDKEEMKKGGKMKKAKSGGAFGMLSVKAGIDKNPNPTQADRIAGAKGMAKKGAKVAKKMKSGGTVSMQLGSYTRTIGKNYSGKAKMGKSMGKCKYGC